MSSDKSMNLFFILQVYFSVLLDKWKIKSFSVAIISITVDTTNFLSDAVKVVLILLKYILFLGGISLNSVSSVNSLKSWGFNSCDSFCLNWLISGFDLVELRESE